MNLHKLNPFAVYRGLPRQVYVIFFATVVNGMGIFVYPFLTLFLTQRLGYTPVQAGLFLSVAALAYFPGSAIGGKLADTVGRRSVMVISQSLASLTFIACGFLGSSPLVPALILLNLFFDGVTDPARSAMMKDVTTPENRQSAFGLNYLGHNLGYSVGPLFAGFLFKNATGWLFFGNAIAGFLAMALTVAFVGETIPVLEDAEGNSVAGEEKEARASRDRPSGEDAVEGSLLTALKAKKGLLVFALLVFWYGAAYQQTSFSLPLSTVAVFGESGAAVYGSLMSLNAVIVILLNAPILSLTRRFRVLSNVAFAGILYALGFAGYAFARTLPVFWICTLLWTVGEIVDAVNTWAYIANETPKSHRGRFDAVFGFITGAGRQASPAAGGKVIALFGLGALWLATSALTLLSAVGVRLLDVTIDCRRKREGRTTE